MNESNNISVEENLYNKLEKPFRGERTYTLLDDEGLGLICVCLYIPIYIYALFFLCWFCGSKTGRIKSHRIVVCYSKHVHQHRVHYLYPRRLSKWYLEIIFSYFIQRIISHQMHAGHWQNRNLFLIEVVDLEWNNLSFWIHSEHRTFNNNIKKTLPTAKREEIESEILHRRTCYW